VLGCGSSRKNLFHDPPWNIVPLPRSIGHFINAIFILLAHRTLIPPRTLFRKYKRRSCILPVWKQSVFSRAARTHVSYPPDPVTSKCHSVPNSSRSQRWKILPIVLNEAIWLRLHLAETNSSLRRHRLENLHLSRTALKALGMSIQHCSPTPVYNSASRPRAAGVQHNVTWLTQPHSRCNEPKDVSRQQDIFGNRGYLGKLEQSK
jgi:hypothetical protein